MKESYLSKYQQVGGGGHLSIDLTIAQAKNAVRYIYHCEPSKLRYDLRYPFLVLFDEWQIPAKEVCQLFGISQPTHSRHLRLARYHVERQKYLQAAYARIRAHILYIANTRR